MGHRDDRGPGGGVRHLVWDWNGTLFDDHAAVVAAINDALASMRLRPIDSDAFRTHFTRPVERFYEQVVGRPIRPGEWRALDEAYHLSYAAAVERLRLVADAREALADAEAAGLTQSLLSMWRHQDLVPLVERLDIDRFFLRVDGLRVAGGGSKTEHLVAHLAALEVEPSAALLVGDALDDLAAARAVGAGCVLYDGGTHHRDALEATGVPVVDTLTAAVAYASAS
jgi:phosphoglycolate phosphatase-like HAD superfamily hydrolase